MGGAAAAHELETQVSEPDLKHCQRDSLHCDAGTLTPCMMELDGDTRTPDAHQLKAWAAGRRCVR